jgi:hypothetical protein
MIKNSYSNASSSGHYLGAHSNTFPLLQGVHQRAILSPLPNTQYLWMSFFTPCHNLAMGQPFVISIMVPRCMLITYVALIADSPDDLQAIVSNYAHQTAERCTLGRSAFLAMNEVGSRFGYLHPIMSYRLYQALCLPITLYGPELTKTEPLMLERVYLKILRTIPVLDARYLLCVISLVLAVSLPSSLRGN